jgi:hypothetical protein
MLNMAFLGQLKADDQTLQNLSIEDAEAFFLFIANSIEEHGELITPLDIEELNIDETNDMNSDQEETIQ